MGCRSSAIRRAKTRRIREHSGRKDTAESSSSARRLVDTRPVNYSLIRCVDEAIILRITQTKSHDSYCDDANDAGVGHDFYGPLLELTMRAGEELRGWRRIHAFTSERYR